MNSTFIKQWIIGTLVRMVKTAAQTALGIIGASVTLGDVNWQVLVSATVLAALACFLTCLAGIPEVKEGSSLRQIYKSEE